MFFWNSTKLAEQLHAEQISQQEQSRYYLACICSLYCMYMFLAYFFSSITIILFSFFGIVIGCIAVPHCLKINQNNDNKQFIQRMVCLGFIATVRILTVSLLVIAVRMLLEYLFLYQAPEAGRLIVQCLLICCIHICFYMSIAQGMRVKARR